MRTGFFLQIIRGSLWSKRFLKYEGSISGLATMNDSLFAFVSSLNLYEPWDFFHFNYQDWCDILQHKNSQSWVKRTFYRTWRSHLLHPTTSVLNWHKAQSFVYTSVFLISHLSYVVICVHFFFLCYGDINSWANIALIKVHHKIIDPTIFYCPIIYESSRFNKLDSLYVQFNFSRLLNNVGTWARQKHFSKNMTNLEHREGGW